jgi:peptidoglycan/xylan/chitin deacetylase (PgdA/CDA1 family)
VKWLDDKETINEPAVVFSFDDAYLSFYEEIYPILRENNLSVFMFVPTGFIGRGDYFWEDELEIALQKADASSVAINGRRFYLYSRLYRTDFHEGVLRYLRYLDTQHRDEIKNNLLARLRVNITETDMSGYQFLSWAQILEMDKSGLVVFGSHTVNHENLNSLSDETVRFELQESKRILENHLEKRVQAFAYPYGGAESFNEKIISALEEAGYVCAFTTIQGRIREKGRHRFRLQRAMLFDYQNEGTVALKLDRFGT